MCLYYINFWQRFDTALSPSIPLCYGQCGHVRRSMQKSTPQTDIRHSLLRTCPEKSQDMYPSDRIYNCQNPLHRRNTLVDRPCTIFHWPHNGQQSILCNKFVQLRPDKYMLNTRHTVLPTRQDSFYRYHPRICPMDICSIWDSDTSEACRTGFPSHILYTRWTPWCLLWTSRNMLCNQSCCARLDNNLLGRSHKH